MQSDRTLADGHNHWISVVPTDVQLSLVAGVLVGNGQSWRPMVLYVI